ncbi:MAG: DNA-binding protein WhiA [Ruminiclostridium sp.]
MSFSNEVKQELCRADISSATREAFTYGLLYGFRSKKPLLLTDSECTADCFKNILPPKSVIIKTPRERGGKSFSVELLNRELLEKYGFFSPEINTSVVNGNDIIAGVFLRGIFLSCGSVSVQKAGYHLELSPGSLEKCENLHRLINEQGMRIEMSSRKSAYFLYSKDSENISDFLTFIGAMQSSMEIMNIKIIKEVRSNINRKVNCEAANIEKTASASAKQIMDIRTIEEKTGLEALPEELREIALLRLENPDVSLSGLGKLLPEPISRSGVNHRLARISKLAEELRKEK